MPEQESNNTRNTMFLLRLIADWTLAASVLLAGGLGLLLTRETQPSERDETAVMRGTSG